MLKMFLNVLQKVIWGTKNVKTHFWKLYFKGVCDMIDYM